MNTPLGPISPAGLASIEYSSFFLMRTESDKISNSALEPLTALSGRHCHYSSRAYLLLLGSMAKGSAEGNSMPHSWKSFRKEEQKPAYPEQAQGHKTP